MNEHPSGPYLTEKRNWEEYRMRLYLIRHGRQCSQLCNVNVDLALEGFRQAELLGERLAGEKIEAVKANNEGMAQGAIAALQAQGYNNGDAAKTIPVVGVDATAAAQDLISKGFMVGSVLQAAYNCDLIS